LIVLVIVGYSCEPHQADKAQVKTLKPFIFVVQFPDGRIKRALLGDVDLFDSGNGLNKLSVTCQKYSVYFEGIVTLLDEIGEGSKFPDEAAQKDECTRNVNFGVPELKQPIATVGLVKIRPGA